MDTKPSEMNDMYPVEGQEPEKTQPEAIRQDIRTTRADLAETVNAIQDKLNPQRIREEAVSTVREATVGRFEDMADDAKWKVKGVGYDVIDTIKRNPMPAALAAIGLGWLFMESRGKSSEREMRRYGREYGGREGDRHYYAGERSPRRSGAEAGYSYDEYGRRSTDGEAYGGGFEQQGQGIRDRAGEVVGQATGKVQDVAGQAASKVQDVAGSAADTAGQVVDSAKQGVQQIAQEAQYRAQRVGTRFGEIMEGNPLLIGAAALALGAAVGFAFPSTEKENELMGQTRDRLMERAGDAASETAQKVQRVAEEATSAAKEAVKSEAEKQNLTSGSSS